MPDSLRDNVCTLAKGLLRLGNSLEHTGWTEWAAAQARQLQALCRKNNLASRLDGWSRTPKDIPGTDLQLLNVTRGEPVAGDAAGLVLKVIGQLSIVMRAGERYAESVANRASGGFPSTPTCGMTSQELAALGRRFVALASAFETILEHWDEASKQPEETLLTWDWATRKEIFVAVNNTFHRQLFDEGTLTKLCSNKYGDPTIRLHPNPG